ncbi:MAG: hypothetical protein M1836_002691 [Candelina mexicana]|nr:MAG: hypothetical protein M1836_002691 [Candelina mexicana]
MTNQAGPQMEGIMMERDAKISSCGNKRCYLCYFCEDIDETGSSHRREDIDLDGRWNAPEFFLQVDDISARYIQHEKEITPPTEAAHSTFPECIIIGSRPQFQIEMDRDAVVEGNLNGQSSTSVAPDIQEQPIDSLAFQAPLPEPTAASPEAPISNAPVTAEGTQEHPSGSLNDQHSRDGPIEHFTTATDNFSTTATRGGDSVVQDAPFEGPAAVAEILSSKFAENQDAFRAIHAENHSILQGVNVQQHKLLGLQDFDDRLAIPFGYEYAAPRSLPFEAMNTDAPLLESAPSLHESETPRIQAFAKLEFDDRPFYMNTYSIVLGRDILAARKAAQRDAEGSREIDAKVKKQTSGSSHDDRAKASSSLNSEGGGINGGERHNVSFKKKKRSKKSKSTSSSSHFLSRTDSITVHPSVTTNDQSMIPNSLGSPEAGVRPVDPASLLPSPDECPLVPLHPPAAGPGEPSSHKGISRRHARIAYNFDKHFFELSILGINGAFVDEVWYAAGDVITLKNGSHIQIGNASLNFMLPDVPPGATGAEELEGSDPPHGGKMSFEFENARGDGIPLGSNSSGGYDSSEDRDNDDDDESSTTGTEEGDREDRSIGVTGPCNAQVDGADDEGNDIEPEPIPQPMPVKRKGPGRPPKNGFMSKREQAQRAREAKLAAKRTAAAQAPPTLPNTKGKKGSKTKTPSPIPNSTDPPKKRAYKKRQPKAVEDQPQPSIEPKSASEGANEQEAKEVKPPKEKKPMRAPKSPSPVFDVSKLTAEDLAKPQASYVILIYDALSATGEPMSLSQIYHAIARKYPYYSVKVTTKGWESSVRHNLSQHSAFVKVAKDGKGYLWGLNPGVSIDKEKRKRISPPAPPSQPYLQQQSIMGHPPHYSSIPPSHPGPGQTYTPAPQHNMPPQLPNGIPLANGPLPQPTPPTNGYTSPYAPPPLPVPPTVPQTQSQYHRPSNIPTPVPQRPPQPSLSSSHNGANGFYANTTRFQPPPYPSHSAPQIPNNTTQNQLPPLPRPTPPPLTQPQPSQPPPTPRIPNSKASTEVLQAFTKFKIAFVNQMGDKARGEAIVSSAINRTLGLSNKSNVPGPEDPSEAVVLKTLQGMLGGLGKKNEAAKVAMQQQSPSMQQQQQQQQSQGRQTPGPATQHQSQIQQLQQLMPSQNQQQGGSSGAGQGRTSQAQLLQILAQVGREKEKKENPLKAGHVQANNSGTSGAVNGTASHAPARPAESSQAPSASQTQNAPEAVASIPSTANGDTDGDVKVDDARQHGSGLKRARQDSVGEEGNEDAKRVRGAEAGV